MEDKRKIIGTLIGILGFIAVMAGLTYAMYTIDDSNANVIKGGHECINISYAKGNDINATELNFVDVYTESAATTTITFYEDETCGNYNGTIYIYTNESSSSSLLTGLTTSGVSHGVLRYTIEKKVGSNGVSETYTGYITSKGDTEIEVGLLENSQTTYTVYLWLEKDTTGTIDNGTISEVTYSGYIHASARQTSTYTK